MTSKQIEKVENCKYLLPCGWCDRLDEKCHFYAECEDTKKDNDKCDHVWELVNNISTSAGLLYRCKKCSATKYEPINSNLWTTTTTPFEKYSGVLNIPDSCKNCPNHPSNGGSGICNCILGQPTITCSTVDQQICSSSSNATYNSNITGSKELEQLTFNFEE